MLVISGVLRQAEIPTSHLNNISPIFAISPANSKPFIKMIDSVFILKYIPSLYYDYKISIYTN